MNAHVKENEDYGYYLELFGNMNQDSKIARQLEMGKEEYQDLLVEQFNGIMNNGESCKGVFFRNEEDTRKAINWVECTARIHELGR